MKCPKCHYLSFDPEPRCRNCGFSLGLEATDLPMVNRDAAADAPGDLELRSSIDDAHMGLAFDGATARVTMPALAEAGDSGHAADLDAVHTPAPRPVRRIAAAPRGRARSVDEQRAPVVPFGAAPASVHPTTELPLFVKGLSDVVPDLPSAPGAYAVDAPAPMESTEAPIVVPAVAPMAQSAVAEAEVFPPAPVEVAVDDSDAAAPAHGMWSGARKKLGPLDRDLLDDVARIEQREREEDAAAPSVEDPTRVGMGRRLAAAVVDGVVLAALLAGLVAVTLRWTLLGWDDLAMLSAWPALVFFGLMAYGYLLLFTAATGQTPGKMVVGIRVVGLDDDGGGQTALSPARACVRELLALPGMLALGLGFWPALVGSERGLHDRLAATRVVRA